MFIKQISVFAENKPGSIMEITGVLKDAGVNIRAMSIADNADFGIVRMIVNTPNEAAKALRDMGMTVVETPVIAISVGDTPGSFHGALEALYEGAVTIEYSYAFVAPVGGGATVILRCAEPDTAVELLKKHGTRMLTQDEVV